MLASVLLLVGCNSNQQSVESHTSVSSFTYLYAANSSIEIELSRKGSTITTTVGTFVNTYNDFDLGKVDTEYDYVGLFASKQADIYLSMLVWY